MTELVTRRLREEILNGALQPGERIVQENVAKRYGTSRVPVREALRHLATEGLVTHQRDVGARVVPINPGELIEVYRIRELLEPAMVHEAVPLLTVREISELRDLLAESEAHVDDLAEYLKLDRQFHFIILQASKMPRFFKISEGLWDTTRLYRRIFAGSPHHLNISVIEHRLLIDAIERRAAEDAAQICTIHTRRARLALGEHVEKGSKGEAGADREGNDKPATGV